MEIIYHLVYLMENFLQAFHTIFRHFRLSYAHGFSFLSRFHAVCLLFFFEYFRFFLTL